MLKNVESAASADHANESGSRVHIRGHSSRPRALDLFCGAGGATRGLQLAGFHVTGVDLRPQPRYCGDAFVQADALRPPFDLSAFDFIWASPPCQRFSLATIRAGTRDDHPDLIEPTRFMLRRSGAPFAIENVPAAPIRPDIVLTGCMFGLNTYRRRHFETSFFVLAPPWGSPFGPESRPGAVTVAGHSGGRFRRRNDPRTAAPRNGDGAAWRAAMGIDWMTNAELAQAIPPAYSEFIGQAALDLFCGAEPRRTFCDLNAKRARPAVRPSGRL